MESDNNTTTNNVSPDTRTVYIAFALVFGAGMATAIGASVVIFLPKLVTNHTVMNRYVLASSLGISAGVMIYVSMIEIFQKSRIAFIDAGYAENIAYAYATACFFAGVCIMMLLNVLVTHFLHSHHHHQSPELQHHVRQTHQRHQRRNPEPTTTPATDAGDATTTTPARTTQTTTSTSVTQDLAQRLEHEPPSICCASEDPVRDLVVLHQMAEILVAEQEQRERKQQQQTVAHPKMTTLDENEPVHVHEKLNDEPLIDGTNSNNNNDVIPDDGAESNSAGSSQNGSSMNQDDDDANHHHDDNDRKLLLRMSMNTAIAIGLHNFPEGLATFVATLHDPQVGVILAIAIAIHNIPEGLCVALPVYYATGSRSKAFGWAILSGLSEPLAAIFGYIILANAVTGTIYGILFGIVAGMMVMISTRELLPTAHRYDPTDRVVTYSFIFGMGILALSLVLFVL